MRRLLDILHRLPQGVMILASIAIINVIAAFFREATLAYFFGASAELDTFLAAFTIPNLLFANTVQITVGVVLPIYVSYRANGQYKEATALVRQWFWYTGRILALVCVLLFVLAGPVMSLLAPGFSTEQHEDAVVWLRTLLPYVWLMAVGGTFKVVLDSHRLFAAPQLASSVVSICVIVSCAVLASSFGVGSLAVGFLGGAMLSFTLQLLRARGVEPLPGFRRHGTRVQLPILAGGVLAYQSFAQHAGILIDRGFASTLPEGSIAALNFAITINAVPTTVVSAALATALFPTISEMAARNEWRQAFRISVKWMLLLAMIVTAPMIGLIVFREEVVSLVFERGNFDAQAAYVTASVLAVLPLAFVINGSSLFFERLLLAQRKLFPILLIATLAVVLKVMFNFLFIDRWGLVGLASASICTLFILTVLRIFFSYRFANRYAPQTMEVVDSSG